jgi:triphosphatase
VLLAMPAVKSEVRLKLVSTYDTPGLALHRERLSLRVRKVGLKFVQTVKAENPSQVDMLERKEWEDQIPSMRPVLEAPNTGKPLADMARDDELRPVFTTTVTRTVITITPDPSAQIEAAVDEGEICASKGDAVAPISEIELELKNGDPQVLFDVALRLLDAAPIRIETRSQVERGYRLLRTDGLTPQAVRMGPIALDTAISVEAALERIGRRCLMHLLCNEQASLAGEPEGIHQMRVAIRRLRAALLALKRMLPMKHYRWPSEELRWTAHALGVVRNWDIYQRLHRSAREPQRLRSIAVRLLPRAEACVRRQSRNRVRPRSHTASGREARTAGDAGVSLCRGRAAATRRALGEAEAHRSKSDSPSGRGRQAATPSIPRLAE